MGTSRSNSAPQEYSRAKFRIDDTKAEQLFSNPLLFVSIRSKYHQDESLKATVALLNKRHKQNPGQFKTLDVLVSGSLQRHNWWVLSENLTNKKLAKVLKGMRKDLNLEELAVELARKFMPLAKKAENKYITDNLGTYFSNMPDTKVTFIPWNKMIPGISNDETIEYGNYPTYYAKLKAGMETNKSLQEAFKVTSNRLLQAKKKLIMKQGQTMRSLSPAMAHLTDNDIWALASICSRNFLMEEAPLLFARLGDLNYSSIIYPAALTEAFQATTELFRDKPKPEWVVIHIEEIKKSDEYAYSSEATVPMPTLQRSLSQGSLTVQTSPFSYDRRFFAKSKVTTPPASSTDSADKINNPPTPRKLGHTLHVPIVSGFHHEDPSTARTNTSDTETSTPVNVSPSLSPR